MVSFEAIRFPLIFGSFLLAVGTAFVYREHLIPDLEEEKKKLFKGDEKTQEAVFKAIKSMK